MKNTKLFSFFVILFISINFISCDNEPIDPALAASIENPGTGGNPGDGNNSGIFKADFSGQTFTATLVTAFISGNSIKMQGLRGTQGEGFGFILTGSTTGNYPSQDNFIAFTPPNSEYGYWAFNNANPNQNVGNVVVTNINTVAKTISGTFSFTGYWSNDTVSNILPIVFSNGVFTDIPYVTQNPTNDTFFAKVNGNEFVDTDITIVSINNILGIGATNASQAGITVGVDEDLVVGTYPITGNLANDDVQINYSLSSATGMSAYANSGSVTITSKSFTRIKGTFTGTVLVGTNTYSITEGAFDVEY